MAAAKVTIDHDVIREWAESRNGKPATVKSTEGGNGDAGILRIDFPGYSGEGTLETVSWDEWFRVFDDRELAFLFQDRAANGKRSRFNKLVSRDSIDESHEVVESEENEMEDEEPRRPSKAA